MTTVTLRAPEPDHLDMLFRWENDPSQWHNALTPPVTARHLLWQFIQESTGDIGRDGQVRFIITDASGEPVGMVDLCDYDGRNRTAWLSIYIDAEHRGRGLGRAAVKAVCRMATEAYGIERLGALVAADNNASQKLFAACGFTPCGMLPQWLRRGTLRCTLLIFSKTL